MWNKAQKEFIETLDGRVSLIAVAGSGKSTATVERIKNLVSHGVNPKDILATSFTKAGAEALTKKLKKEKIVGVKSSTIHSLAYSIVTQEHGGVWGSKLIPSWKTNSCLYDLYKVLGGAEDDFREGNILGAIGIQQGKMLRPKDNMEVREEFELEEDQIRYYYEGYENYKKKNDLMDFNDYIKEAIRIVKKKRDYDFKYCICDEGQDISLLQYTLIDKVTSTHNLAIVGDYQQCLVPTTKIKTTEGYKEVQDVTIEDKLIVGSGFGETSVGEIENIPTKQYNGNIIKITTEDGNVLECTPNHMVFADRLIYKKYTLYMTYREGYGFRIGQSCNYKYKKKNGEKLEIKNGFVSRMCQEKGTKVWCLACSDDVKEISYLEQYYAYKYGIPLYPFESNNRGMTLDNESVKLLFQEVGAYEKGMQLLKDMDLMFDYPLHFPEGGGIKNGIRLRMGMFVERDRKQYGEKVNKHCLSFTTNDLEFKQEVEKIIGREIPYHKNKAGNGAYDFRHIISDYDTLMEEKERIEQLPYKIDFIQQGNFSVDKTKMTLVPACNIKEGMTVAVFNKDGIIESKYVAKVEKYKYSGLVYDINVKFYRNYLAENIVVHNCIYGFNAGDQRIIMDYYKNYKDVKVINMNINYRSGRKIIDNANTLTSYYYGNYKHFSKTKCAQDYDGLVKYKSFEDEGEESRWVFEQIKAKISKGEDLDSIAVIYRNNKMSQIMEALLKSEGIEYTITGGGSIFDYKEIKTINSILRLIESNYKDDLAMKELAGARVLDGFKFLPNIDIKRIEDNAMRKGISLFESYYDTKYTKRGQITSILGNIQDIKGRFEDDTKSGRIIAAIISKFKIKEIIKRDNKDSSEGKLLAVDLVQDKCGNKTLFDSITFLSEGGQVDKKRVGLGRRKKSAITLTTAHSSKGLQWKITYVIQANKIGEINEDGVNLAYVSITRAEKELYITDSGESDLLEVMKGNVRKRS